MPVAPHPEVSGLFVSAEVIRAGGVWFSGTGLGSTPAAAVLRSRAELCERQALAQRRDSALPPGAVMGSAAGPDRAFARHHALLEAVERHAAARWWAGRTLPRPPPPAARAALARTMQRHTRRRGRGTKLIDITGAEGVPVLVAWSTAEAGRDLCFGLAARPTAVAAAEAALIEVFQMEFALGLARRRVAAGLALPAGDGRLLRRADSLAAGDLANLLRPRGPAPSHRRVVPGLSAMLHRKGWRLWLRDWIADSPGQMRSHVALAVARPPAAAPRRRPPLRWPLY